MSEEDGSIDDLSDLASILGVPRRELRAAIGCPWYRVRPAAYDLDLGPMFVGRDGDSAAILCLASAEELIGPGGVVTRAGGTVLVGMALDSTLPDGGRGWRLGGSTVGLTRGVGTEARGFLSALHDAVTRAVSEKAPLLAAESRYASAPV